MEIFKQLKIAFLALFFFSILTGLIYPLLATGVAQLLFPWRANGSLIVYNNRLVGSELIGQYFTDPKYFWGRPSATLFFPYNAENSQGSNLAPSNLYLLKIVKERILNLQKADFKSNHLIPVDLVTASGSGLDPEISLQAAFYQVSRIARMRNLPEETVQRLIRQSAKNRKVGIWGEPRVNVLQLNLALDRLNIESFSLKKNLEAERNIRKRYL